MITVRKPTQREAAECSKWPIWQKEPSTFPWEYDEKETCLILEGKATVTSDAGEKAIFGKGDLVIFPEGLKCKWTITEKIKKHYMFG